MTRRDRYIAASLLILLAGCFNSTSPDLAHLNGDWSTGHSITGLEVGLTLDWSDKSVQGSGNYLALDTGTQCGSDPPLSTVVKPATLHASRSSPTEISGSIAFADNTPVRFEGTLVDSSAINGSFPRLIGSLVGADGTKCPLEFIHATVPIP